MTGFWQGTGIGRGSGWRRAVSGWLAVFALATLLVGPAGAAPASAEPARLSEQWNLRQINADRAWAITRGSPDIIVGVIDTGVDAKHPELDGKVVEGRNFADNNDRTTDVDGHGTFTAGVIAGRGVEMLGVAPGVKIMPLRVFGRGTSLVDPMNDYVGIARATADAIRWGVDHGARILNISLGWQENTREVQAALEYAWTHNALVFVACGNDDQDWTHGEPAPNYPAASRYAVAVAATNTQGEHASYSTTGEYIQLAAPGGDVDYGSYMIGGSARREQLVVGPRANSTGYDYHAGTSFASPHAAGVAALVWSVNPNLTNQQVLQILFDTAARPAGQQGRSNSYGWGRIDAYRAVLGALQAPLTVAITSPHQLADANGTLDIAGWVSRPASADPADIDVAVALVPERGDPIPLGRTAATPDAPALLQAGGSAPPIAVSSYRLEASTDGLPRGRHRLSVVATASTGEQASYDVEVELK